jgi:hypothetical protein
MHQECTRVSRAGEVIGFFAQNPPRTLAHRRLDHQADRVAATDGLEHVYFHSRIVLSRQMHRRKKARTWRAFCGGAIA